MIQIKVYRHRSLQISRLLPAASGLQLVPLSYPKTVPKWCKATWSFYQDGSLDVCMCRVDRQMPTKTKTYNFQTSDKCLHIIDKESDRYLLTPPNRFKTGFTSQLENNVARLGYMIGIKVYSIGVCSYRCYLRYLSGLRLVPLRYLTTSLKPYKTPSSSYQEGSQVVEMFIVNRQRSTNTETCNF